MKRLKRTIFFITLMSGLSSAPALRGQDISLPLAASNPTNAIAQLRDGLIESFNRGDVDALLSHLDTNVVVTWQNGEVSLGREGVRSYYERMMGGESALVQNVEAKPEIEGRHVYGDWAVSWGQMNDTFELSDGRTLNFQSRFSATIAQRGDVWLVTSFHASADVFDNPVLTLAIGKVGLYAGVIAGLIGGVIGLIIGFMIRRPKR